MSSIETNANKNKSKIFETLLSSPGMTDKSKINLMLSRQNIILISRLIEVGLRTEKNAFDDEIFTALPKESVDELKVIQAEILLKANLSDFYERLKLL